MGLFDGLLDETPTTTVDTTPLPSNDTPGSILPKLLMAGGLMGSALSGNDQTAKILPLFLRQQAAEALQERQRAQREGSSSDYNKLEGALTNAYQESGGDANKAAQIFSQTIRSLPPTTDPAVVKMGVLAVQKLREKGLADQQEARYQGIENQLLTRFADNPLAGDQTFMAVATASGLPTDRAIKLNTIRKNSVETADNNGIRTFSTRGPQGDVISSTGGIRINNPDAQNPTGTTITMQEGRPVIAPTQGTATMAQPKPGEGLLSVTQGESGPPVASPTGISAPQKVENTNDLVNAAAFHKVDLRQLEQDMNSPDQLTVAKAQAVRQVLATHALAEKLFTPETLQLAAKTGNLKKLYDQVTSGLLGNIQSSMYGNPAEDVDKARTEQKATEAGAQEQARNAPLIQRALGEIPGKVDLYNQTVAENQRQQREDTRADKNAQPVNGSKTYISRNTFLGPGYTPTQGEAASEEFRKEYADLSQQKALMVDRANRALNTVDAVKRQAEEMNTDLARGGVTKVKEWLGTGPGKSFRTLVLDTVQEVAPALTGSVRTIGSQFEESLKNAPTLKDQLDVTRVYVAQLSSILDNARRSAMGMEGAKIPTYNDVLNSYTTQSGVRGKVK